MKNTPHTHNRFFWAHPQNVRRLKVFPGTSAGSIPSGQAKKFNVNPQMKRKAPRRRNIPPAKRRFSKRAHAANARIPDMRYGSSGTKKALRLICLADDLRQRNNISYFCSANVNSETESPEESKDIFPIAAS